MWGHFSPQVRRQTVESLDFYQRYETLLRTEVEKKKAHLYKRQAKLANQVQWRYRFERGLVCQACLTSLKPKFLTVSLNRNGQLIVLVCPYQAIWPILTLLLLENKYYTELK